MPRYHVFLNAPSMRELNAADTSQGGEVSFQWQTVAFEDAQEDRDLDESAPQPSLSLPSADFEAASRRISRLYENIIFKDNPEDGEEEFAGETSSGEGKPPGNTQGMHHNASDKGS